MRGVSAGLLMVSCSALTVFAVSEGRPMREGGGIFNCGGFPRRGVYGLDDPLVAGCEMLFEWREVEPEEGAFDWGLVDREMRPWLDAGKRVALRIMSGCNRRNASPEWVFAAGVPRVDSADYSGSDIVFPVWWDPVFVEKYTALAAALARRYDGHPSLEFVQVGGVGRWEETYVHSENEAMNERWRQEGYSHSQYIRHCIRMCETFRTHFTRTPVLLSISIGGPDPEDRPRQEVGRVLAEYAAGQGIWLKQNGWNAFYSYTDHEHFSHIFRRHRGSIPRIYEQGSPLNARWGRDPAETATFRSMLRRALLDGVEYLWIYDCDLRQPEFRQDLAFAVERLGARSFREIDRPFIRFFEREHTFPDTGITRVFHDDFFGLVNHVPWIPARRELVPDFLAGRACKRTTPERPWVHLDLDDGIIEEATGDGESIRSAILTLEFLDRGAGSVHVDYNWNGQEYDARASAPKAGTGAWTETVLILRDLVFPIRRESVFEPDFRLHAEDGDLVLGGVALELPSS